MAPSTKPFQKAADAAAAPASTRTSRKSLMSARASAPRPLEITRRISRRPSPVANARRSRAAASRLSSKYSAGPVAQARPARRPRSTVGSSCPSLLAEEGPPALGPAAMGLIGALTCGPDLFDRGPAPRVPAVGRSHRARRVLTRRFGGAVDGPVVPAATCRRAGALDLPRPSLPGSRRRGRARTRACRS